MRELTVSEAHNRVCVKRKMKRTDTSNPDYFHKVVDCQWGCPAHTDVPEYIRLIAQGRFDDAYMVNRESNIFPGILGRVCDRPCEPACRRGRMGEKPVAICRLKRVCADHRGDITNRLPVAPPEKNGKKVALIGAGCASLAVANDLMPLGYECTIFEAQAVAGGLMRFNIPAFRLPIEVLNEEIAYIVDMGVEVQYNHRIESMKELLEQGFDAVFVGSGAPRGKELKLPGRYDSENIYIGIDWLESVAFEHIDSIGENVLIIGVGNTAMDCCRTSLRLGAKSVKVMARKPREFFKASVWELEDAEEENVEIVVNHSPKEFVIEDGKLKGMIFELMEYVIENGRIQDQEVVGEEFVPATMWCWRLARKTLFPGSNVISALNSTRGKNRWWMKSLSSPAARVCFSVATQPLALKTLSGRSNTATRQRSPSISIARKSHSPTVCRTGSI